jgi:hypothetical protein
MPVNEVNRIVWIFNKQHLSCRTADRSAGRYAQTPPTIPKVRTREYHPGKDASWQVLELPADSGAAHIVQIQAETDGRREISERNSRPKGPFQQDRQRTWPYLRLISLRRPAATRERRSLCPCRVITLSAGKMGEMTRLMTTSEDLGWYLPNYSPGNTRNGNPLA